MEENSKRQSEIEMIAKCEVSVLMSFYNESFEMICKSVDSIINQTLIDWELIIICDNPKKIDLYKKLKEIYIYDKRIRFFINESNLGLAMSMNKAAGFARGKYLARMDSDDICLPTRLEEQYKCMENNEYDLCCTEYQYIDENDEAIFLKGRKYNNKILKKTLPYDNTIHHPTVMFKKEVFESMNGYRNFPCAQDYDLWLRFYDKNISMYLIEKPLIKYRIRSGGVSQSNKFKQIVTIWYIQKCYWERKERGRDRYSIKNYNSYLEQEGVFDERYSKRVNNEKMMKDEIDLYKNKSDRKMHRYWLIVKLLMISRFYRKYYWHLLKNVFRYIM